MTDYFAHVEWTAGCVRVFAGGNWYGDPYVWAATVVRTGDTAVVLGVDHPITPDQARAVASVLVAHGVRYVEWERVKGGKVKRVRVDLCRKNPGEN